MASQLCSPNMNFAFSDESKLFPRLNLSFKLHYWFFFFFFLSAIVAISKSRSHKHRQWPTFVPSSDASDGSATTIPRAAKCIRGSTGCALHDAGTGRQSVHGDDACSASLLRRSTMGLSGWLDSTTRNSTETATDTVARRRKSAICEYSPRFTFLHFSFLFYCIVINALLRFHSKQMETFVENLFFFPSCLKLCTRKYCRNRNM